MPLFLALKSKGTRCKYQTVFAKNKTQKPAKMRVYTNMAEYAINTKYMPISSFLQYLVDNLPPFVVNVIAKHDAAPVSPVPYTR